MKNDNTYDLVVIGGGTGGNGVARKAAKAGWKVASIDELPFGGTCALRGCDPKKMLIAVTEGIEWARNMKGKGLDAEARVRWADAIAFKRSFTDAMPGRIEPGLEKAGITVLHGQARFLDPHTIDVEGSKLQAHHVHIATGARPMTLGIPGEDLLATSTDFLEMTTLPERIVFVGGGFIAMEFAHIARRAGAREVTVLEMAERVLGPFDPDMVAVVSEASRELGIDLRTGTKVERIERSGDDYTVHYRTTDGEQSITCDRVVHATGRVPNIEALDLDAAGVKYGRKGIQVSAFMRSSQPHIFAAGDCADSGPNLTPVSAYEAHIAAKNLLAGKDVSPLDYPPIPSVVFTLPQLAAVGLSEAQAREQGLDVEVHQENTAGWYSSLRVGARHSAYKVLVEKESGKILGAHLVGPGAEEQINLFAMAMTAGLNARRIKGMIFAYPSFASDLGSMV